ncbi:MAG: fibronectin/fibrinogen-binding protein [Oscillatoriales cyanobacterium]|nr:MAG: fibronectin/fibrinogen-binding protein [Oscillatoriales cyanobacterium]
MQPVDYTTLKALAIELRDRWIPSRLEQVYQLDRTRLALALRTIERRAWLHICWHPQAAHVAIGDAPPKGADTFTFSDQLRHQLKGLALVEVADIAPWERVLDFRFARRPGDAIIWHLYVEIMGQYSNAILVDRDAAIVTAAHQVSSQQSSVRPILTGKPYEIPPSLTDPSPSLTEGFERWRDRVALVPDTLRRNLTRTYRGVSSSLADTLAIAVGLNPNASTATLTPEDWQNLFQVWCHWLHRLETGVFQPVITATGYTVLGDLSADQTDPQVDRTATHDTSIQTIVFDYYRSRLDQQTFTQVRHQLSQKVTQALKKLTVKRDGFAQRLTESADADAYRQQADLLMAHLHEWQPGMTAIVLQDFETGDPVTIPLNPEGNAVYNAQRLYKKHQKLKRARNAVQPLLEEVQAEIAYLEQVDATIATIDRYHNATDLEALEDIRDELIEQGYIAAPQHHVRRPPDRDNFHRYHSPSGYEILIGRNNSQNDRLTFRVANDYDLWFHTQEIPGSHVLLRLKPGAVADPADMQHVANLTAYYSRAQHSEAVPVVYTAPRHVYKPKGAKPGIAIYKHEQVIWGQPQQVDRSLNR